MLDRKTELMLRNYRELHRAAVDTNNPEEAARLMRLIRELEDDDDDDSDSEVDDPAEATSLARRIQEDDSDSEVDDPAEATSLARRIQEDDSDSEEEEEDDDESEPESIPEYDQASSGDEGESTRARVVPIYTSRSAARENRFNELRHPMRTIGRQPKTTAAPWSSRRRRIPNINDVVEFMRRTQRRFFDFDPKVTLVVQDNEITVRKNDAFENADCMRFTVRRNDDQISLKEIFLSSLKHSDADNCYLKGKSLLEWLIGAADHFQIPIRLIDAAKFKPDNADEYSLSVFCILQDGNTWYQRRGFTFKRDGKEWIQENHNQKIMNLPISAFRKENFNFYIRPILVDLFDMHSNNIKYGFNGLNIDNYTKDNDMIRDIRKTWYIYGEVEDHLNALDDIGIDEDNTTVTELFNDETFLDSLNEVSYFVNFVFDYIIGVPGWEMVYYPQPPVR